MIIKYEYFIKWYYGNKYEIIFIMLFCIVKVWDIKLSLKIVREFKCCYYEVFFLRF